MTRPGWKIIIVMTRSNWELVVGAMGVAFLGLVYVVWNIKLDLKWYALGFIGSLIVLRSIKRIVRRRRNNESN